MEVFNGREELHAVRELATRRNGRRLQQPRRASKGPLTTPVGGGIRSLNVALRQLLDLYCLPAPGALVQACPSPVKSPGEGRHGDLPREHRTSTRASRLRRRHAGSEEGLDFFAKEFPTSRRSASRPTPHRRAGSRKLEGIGAGSRSRCRAGPEGRQPLGTERLVHQRDRLRDRQPSARASRSSTSGTS